MERLALITIILPFVGAFIVGLNKKHFAQIATVFAAFATLGTMLVAGQWFADGHQSVTYDIVAFDKFIKSDDVISDALMTIGKPLPSN